MSGADELICVAGAGAASIVTMGLLPIAGVHILTAIDCYALQKSQEAWCRDNEAWCQGIHKSQEVWRATMMQRAIENGDDPNVFSSSYPFGKCLDVAMSSLALVALTFVAGAAAVYFCKRVSVR